MQAESPYYIAGRIEFNQSPLAKAVPRSIIGYPSPFGNGFMGKMFDRIVSALYIFIPVAVIAHWQKYDVGFPKWLTPAVFEQNAMDHCRDRAGDPAASCFVP